jgi:hypothetical protein
VVVVVVVVEEEEEEEEAVEAVGEAEDDVEEADVVTEAVVMVALEQILAMAAASVAVKVLLPASMPATSPVAVHREWRYVPRCCKCRQGVLTCLRFLEIGCSFPHDLLATEARVLFHPVLLTVSRLVQR